MSFIKSAWMWIKRILFVVSMLLAVGISIIMFRDIEGALNIFLNILVIIISIGSCVLYFIFNEYKKWPIVLPLIILLVLSIYLTIAEAKLFPVSIMCAVLGIIISCGTKWISKASKTLNNE